MASRLAFTKRTMYSIRTRPPLAELHLEREYTRYVPGFGMPRRPETGHDALT
jgi:hypothetical protein